MGGTPARQAKRRSAVRVVTVVWAAFWAMSGTGAVAQDWGAVSTGSSLGALAFFVVFAFLPLALHLWCTRAHPLPAMAPASAESMAPGATEARLDHIGSTLAELSRRRWLQGSELSAVERRHERLLTLAEADQLSIAGGNPPSSALAAEIDQLAERVTSILDAAIHSEAVAPGDDELDMRLEQRADELRARGQAVADLEGRTTAEG